MGFISSNTLCPISDKRINEQVARLNAGFTVLLLIIFLIAQNILPLIFLAIDFLLRTSGQEKYSAVAITSLGIARYLELKKKVINAGPKLFAARIGFIFSVLSIVLWLFNLKIASLALASLLGIFSFLEAAAGICVACAIYPYVYRWMYKG